MALYLFRYMTKEGRVVTTRRFEFSSKYMAEKYGQSLALSAYGDVSGVDVKPLNSRTKFKSKRRTFRTNKKR